MSWQRNLLFAILALTTGSLLPGCGASRADTARARALPPPILQVQEAPAPVPPLELEKTVHDFGRLKDEEPVQCTFAFKNPSGRTITIKKIHPGCSCIEATTNKPRYGPDDHGTIEVRFDPTLRRGKDEKRITIETDHPTQPRIEVTIKADINPRVRFEPTSVFFGNVERGTQSPPRTLEVIGRTPGFAISEASSGDPRVSLRAIGTRAVEIEGEPATAYRYEVLIHAGPETGRVLAPLRFLTNIPGLRTVQMFAQATIVGPVLVTPEMVALRLTEPGRSFEVQLELTHRAGTAFQIRSSRVEGAPNYGLRLAPGSTASATKHAVKLLGTTPSAPQASRDEFRAEAVFVTDVADMPEIRVPISGAFSAPDRR